MYLTLKSKLVCVDRLQLWGPPHTVLCFSFLLMFKAFELRYHSYIRKLTFSMYSSVALVFSAGSEAVTNVQFQLVLPR